MQQYTSVFNNFVSTNDLIVISQLNVQKISYTYASGDNTSLIDNILINNNLASYLQYIACNILYNKDNCSDHLPVSLTLEIRSSAPNFNLFSQDATSSLRGQ